MPLQEASKLEADVHKALFSADEVNSFKVHFVDLSEDELRSKFETADINASGTMNSLELKDFMLALGMQPNVIDTETFSEAFDAKDSEGAKDGEVSVLYYCAVIHPPSRSVSLGLTY